MSKYALSAALLVAGMFVTSPASAQYRFDRRIDPSMCHWTEVCDYGGLALGVRLSCPIETIEDVMPDGRVVVRRERRCPLRVRG